MSRQILCSLFTLLAVAVAPAVADEPKKNDNDKKHMQAIVSKVDTQGNTITVKCADKNGKQEEKTVQLSKDVKCLDAEGKDCKLASLQAGDDVCLTKKDDKVVEVKKHAMATITKVDRQAQTITVKMPDKDGKTTERTFRLIEDAEYVDSIGRVAVLDVFQSGDDILFVEANGTIKAMKKADKQSSTAAKGGSEKK